MLKPSQSRSMAHNVLFINSVKSALQELTDLLRSSGHAVEERVFQQLFSDTIYVKYQIILEYLVNIFRSIKLITSTPNVDTIILNGNLVAPPFLLCRRLLSWCGNNHRVVVLHFFLNHLRKQYIIVKLTRLIFDQRNVTLIVLSRDDEQHYLKILKNATVVFHPLCYYGTPNDQATPTIPKNSYIFAGGWTNRDYFLLLSAARQIDHEFLVCCSEKNDLPLIPPNVTVFLDVPGSTFAEYLKNSGIVVIPLRDDTGPSGQMVALAAMQHKKPIIYARLPCIMDYFEDGVTGLSYRAQDIDDLCKTIRYLLSDPELGETLGLAAHRKLQESFRPQSFYKFVENVVNIRS